MIIGVTDIHNVVSVGRITGNALVADGNADFLKLGSRQKHGINFIMNFINDINGAGLRVKKIENAFFEVDQNLGNVFRRMNSVRDVLEILAYPELFIQGNV